MLSRQPVTEIVPLKPSDAAQSPKTALAGRLFGYARVSTD
jgi:hypothetical protein